MIEQQGYIGLGLMAKMWACSKNVPKMMSSGEKTRYEYTRLTGLPRESYLLYPLSDYDFLSAFDINTRFLGLDGYLAAL